MLRQRRIARDKRWGYVSAAVFACSLGLAALSVFPQAMYATASLATFGAAAVGGRLRREGVQLFGMKARPSRARRRDLLIGLAMGLALTAAYVLILVFG